MSDVSREPSEDLEAPTEDAIEQHQTLAGDDEQTGTGRLRAA